jgi:hypothetical protein
MEEDGKPIKDKSIIPKDWTKSYIFNYIDYEIIAIKHLRRRKIRYSFNFFDDEIIGMGRSQLGKTTASVSNYCAL